MCPLFLHYFYLTPVRIGIFFLAILAAVHFFFLICQNKDLIQFLLDRCHATWIFALGQAFFSLSVAGNGTLIYGSYLSDEEDIPASAGRVALFDTIAAILAALVIIPAMATTGAQLDQGGPGLLFIFLPNQSCREARLMI